MAGGVGITHPPAGGLGRSSPRNHRKGFWEPGEEGLGWGRDVELGKPSSPTESKSHPLAPEPYLAPTLLSLYIFPPS